LRVLRTGLLDKSRKFYNKHFAHEGCWTKREVN